MGVPRWLPLLALFVALVGGAARAAAAPDVAATWTVEGYGHSDADAEEVAYRQAGERVRDFLAGPDGDVDWTPAEDDLRAADVVRVIGREDLTTRAAGETHRYRKVTARVTLTPAQAEQFRRLALRDRERRAGAGGELTLRRQRWAGAAVLTVVAVLGVTAFSLRRRGAGGKS